MINVLVPTKPDDTHAIYVKLALEKNGHKSDLWYTSDFPSQQTHSLEIIKDEISWRVKELGLDGSRSQYDIVWYRRPSKPILPDILHPEDINNAKRENSMLFQTLWQVIMPSATWINPANSALRINSKLLQLKVASKIGMTIPKTLISNDPDDIKKYIKQNEGNVIYKSLYPMAWLSTSEMRLTYTSEIKLDDLPSDEILQSTPGIFQEKINKKHELRVTYFGNKYIAVKINSQEHDKGKVDWRYIPTKELILEVTSLPCNLDQYCRSLMKEFGIIFGCFDFIVTHNNEYYFLEINEQGQFLWIEEVNSDIKMLESFVKFLVSYDSEDKKSFSSISLLDFEKDMKRFKCYSERLHKNPAIF